MSELNKLIEEFGEQNEEVKRLKKSTDALNVQIKEILSKAENRTVDTERFTATYSEVVSESFDEEQLLAKLKAMGVEGVIKTKEYVDMDALEDAIYNGNVAGSDLADCKLTKVTPKLVVKIRKEKKKSGDD